MYWFWKRDYPKAIEGFNSLLYNGISVKSESQIYCNIGEIYYWSGNIEEAEKSLRKSLDLNMKTKGHDAHLYELLGIICGKKGQFQEALVFYEKAVQFGSKGLINKMIMNIDCVLKQKALLEENKDLLPFLTAYFQQNKHKFLKTNKDVID